ncbi:two-CW domain-containing protein [Candidatus Magnetomonas plexicatena]|uniref:two-CW domain-containing protein n=1 Tax=Candidatus Magnetomonas plexicatena TaxID=2552947 RepID=UPI0011016CFA|nr:hypothetical protein E2O03_005330 [Nitrospirales bacterium LBB_01]
MSDKQVLEEPVITGNNGGNKKGRKKAATVTKVKKLKISDEPQITEELKVSEEPQITEQPKVSEDLKVTEELKVAEGPKVSETTKVSKKLNCWEFHNCGRQPGGAHVERFGLCPVATATSFNGLHGGVNAGRACWAVLPSVGKKKESYAAKIRRCTKCEFHQLVIKEEEKYQSAVTHLKKHKEEVKAKAFKEPGFIKHIYEKSKHTAYEDDNEVESIIISLLIGWVSLCPSVSMLEGSKRLCKEDLVDELMIIDAIADHPRSRAATVVAKTMFKALRKQVGGYFAPLIDKVKPKGDK